MITPDSPDRLYSTRLRTAVVLTGSGTAGAYHAGVLRALHEAGVRIDLVAGRGMGAVSALFAAVDGGAAAVGSLGHLEGRRGAPVLSSGGAALRVAAGALAGGRRAFCSSRCCCSRSPSSSAWPASLLTLVGFDEAGSALTAGFAGRLQQLVLAWRRCRSIVPRLVLLAVARGRRSGGGQPGRCTLARARGEPQGAGRIAVAADRQSAVAGADAARPSRCSSGP